MARKRKQNPPPRNKGTSPPGGTELAGMIFALKDSRTELPILADFLEEKFGLAETAALFRLPDLNEIPDRLAGTQDFSYFPLTDDVFVWLTRGRFYPDRSGYQASPCMLIGLYAHPQGQRSQWGKITSMLTGEVDPAAERQSPWDPVAKPDPRVEAARQELAAYVNDRLGRE